ncbi:hypothetical protein FBF30_02825 [Candidatus Saccharibacteria bacterium oral taxon 955]|nr:hypothetical protein FBF30_02825 [Candidatus Saccharibacteria bacterium oral taxon 955]
MYSDALNEASLKSRIEELKKELSRLKIYPNRGTAYGMSRSVELTSEINESRRCISLLSERISLLSELILAYGSSTGHDAKEIAESSREITRSTTYIKLLNQKIGLLCEISVLYLTPARL